MYVTQTTDVQWNLSKEGRFGTQPKIITMFRTGHCPRIDTFTLMENARHSKVRKIRSSVVRRFKYFHKKGAAGPTLVSDFLGFLR